MKYVKSILKGLLWISIILGIILFIGRFTFWVPGAAPDNAMAPNIWAGDKFIVFTRGEPGLGGAHRFSVQSPSGYLRRLGRCNPTAGIRGAL